MPVVASDKIQKRQPGSAALALASREDAASPPLYSYSDSVSQSVNAGQQAGTVGLIRPRVEMKKKEKEKEVSTVHREKDSKPTNQQ